MTDQQQIPASSNRRQDRKWESYWRRDKFRAFLFILAVIAFGFVVVLLLNALLPGSAQNSRAGAPTAIPTATLVANVPSGSPEPVPANQPGPTPFVKTGVHSVSQWLYYADTAANHGNWGFWKSLMGVQHLSYQQARNLVNWHVAQEKQGRSFVTTVGSEGLAVTNTRPKSGSYEPFPAVLFPGDRYLKIAADCPYVSHPPQDGDGFRMGCGNPIAHREQVAEKPKAEQPKKPKRKLCNNGKPCTPTWRRPGSPVYQNRPDPGRTAGSSTSGHAIAVANKGTGSTHTGQASTGQTAEADSGGMKANPGTAQQTNPPPQTPTTSVGQPAN